MNGTRYVCAFGRDTQYAYLETWIVLANQCHVALVPDAGSCTDIQRKSRGRGVSHVVIDCGTSSARMPLGDGNYTKAKDRRLSVSPEVAWATVGCRISFVVREGVLI